MSAVHPKDKTNNDHLQMNEHFLFMDDFEMSIARAKQHSGELCGGDTENEEKKREREF